MANLAEEFEGYDGCDGDACKYHGKNEAYDNVLAKLREVLGSGKETKQ
jgi:hypothetical protein